MAVSCTVFDTFDFKNFATLKSVSSVTKGHRNWYLLIACLQMWNKNSLHCFKRYRYISIIKT